MKILVIGGGGREAALVHKISQSKRGSRLFCAPGNPGIQSVATLVPIAAHSVSALLQFSIENQIDLTIVGPELPLSLGIVNRFEEAGLSIFGPSQEAAQVETSKVFSKTFMQKYKIPTPQAQVVSIDEAFRLIETSSFPIPVVLKADGLAAGKGVIIAEDSRSAQEGLNRFREMGESASRILLEEYITGVEATFFVVADGETAVSFGSAKDYKRLEDGDRGPNTGGMGAISPAPAFGSAIETEVLSRIVYPTLKGLVQEGIPYRGILYVGLMLTEKGPLVLEFNARLGDPEAQAVLPRLQTDFIDLVEATLAHRLDRFKLEWSDRTSVCVVLASLGYPGVYKKGEIISGLDQIDDPAVTVFHAGTERKENHFVTSGGRVLGVTALGLDRQRAREAAYRAVDRVSFRGMQYRKEIGQ